MNKYFLIFSESTPQGKIMTKKQLDTLMREISAQDFQCMQVVEIEESLLFTATSICNELVDVF